MSIIRLFHVFHVIYFCFWGLSAPTPTPDPTAQSQRRPEDLQSPHLNSFIPQDSM